MSPWQFLLIVTAAFLAALGWPLWMVERARRRAVERLVDAEAKKETSLWP